MMDAANFKSRVSYNIGPCFKLITYFFFNVDANGLSTSPTNCHTVFTTNRKETVSHNPLEKKVILLIL